MKGANGRGRRRGVLSRPLHPFRPLRPLLRFPTPIQTLHVGFVRSHHYRWRPQCSRDGRLCRPNRAQGLRARAARGPGRRMRHRRDLARLQGLDRGYVNSLFRPEIIRDLELQAARVRDAARAARRRSRRSPTAALLLGPDKAMTHREIAKFSAKDAEAVSRVRGDARARRGLHRADARHDPAGPAGPRPAQPAAARQARPRSS